MILTKMKQSNGVNIMLETQSSRKNSHMLDLFSDSLIKIMIGNSQRKNLQRLRLNNLLPILKVEEKERRNDLTLNISINSILTFK